MQGINYHGVDASIFGSIIDDCVDLICNIHGVVVSNVLRASNNVAHYLTRASISKPGVYY